MTANQKIPDDPVKLAKMWMGRYSQAMHRLAVTQSKLHKLEKDHIVLSAKYSALTKLAMAAGVKPGADVAALLAGGE